MQCGQMHVKYMTCITIEIILLTTKSKDVGMA